MEAIRINNISKEFKDVKALDDVSITFEANKIYGLLGRNGAGKSTLLNIISNRLFADRGDIYVNDLNAKENDRAQRQLYLMSEKTFYPKTMKIKEVFKWSEQFYGSFDYDMASKLCKQFDLNTNKRVKELSTGYSSIYKLIIALCVDVKYVFLDEPVLGLDANHRELFYKILLKSYEDKPRTIIIATHLIEEIVNLIEGIIIINEGKVLVNEEIQELLDSGYSVTGKLSDVDAYCKDKNLIGEDVMGGLKSAYILGKVDHKDLNNLEFNKLNLQKVFIEMTKREEER